jgi:hypothetical protein
MVFLIRDIAAEGDHILDGTGPPTRRRGALRIFKAGQNGPDAFPVALAGPESMAEGHNFFRCSHVVGCDGPVDRNLLGGVVEEVNLFDSDGDGR